eukprot:scaffold50191_cov65-Phaeocystis_antarctica.AAC.1
MDGFGCNFDSFRDTCPSGRLHHGLKPHPIGLHPIGPPLAVDELSWLAAVLNEGQTRATAPVEHGVAVLPATLAIGHTCVTRPIAEAIAHGLAARVRRRVVEEAPPMQCISRPVALISRPVLRRRPRLVVPKAASLASAPRAHAAWRLQKLQQRQVQVAHRAVSDEHDVITPR